MRSPTPRHVLLASSLSLACTDPSGRPDLDPDPVDPGGSESAGESGGDDERPPDHDDDPPPLDVSDDAPADPDPDPHVCYPGADDDWSTCLPVVRFDDPPAGYDYPAPLHDDPAYRAPVAWLDLDALDPDLALAPNFRLGELTRRFTGRFAVVQPHAVERLQGLRDLVGPIGVTSGYRSPDYNASIGGAAHSRHMYGDAFDMHPLDAPLEALEQACVDDGGVWVEYDTHVHCDWRDEALDEGFFGGVD